MNPIVEMSETKQLRAMSGFTALFHDTKCINVMASLTHDTVNNKLIISGRFRDEDTSQKKIFGREDEYSPENLAEMTKFVQNIKSKMRVFSFVKIMPEYQFDLTFAPNETYEEIIDKMEKTDAFNITRANKE
jgi:hypothetical protein